MKKKKSFLRSFINNVKKNVDVDSISNEIKNIQNGYQKNLKDVKTQFLNTLNESGKEPQQRSKPNITQHTKSSEERKETKINYISVNEVSVIIKPKIQKSDGKIIFYDLSGNRVSKIPRGKRDISMENNCYLGLKKYNKTERWEPIKPDEVEKSINDDKFILNHSNLEIKPEKTKKLVQKDLDEFDKLYLKQNKLSSEITQIEKSIQLKQSIILKESFLNKIPIELNFTRVISSKMRFLQNDFNDTQLNKLTRFLSFLEENEEKYNSLYQEGIITYLSNPYSDIFKQISNKYLSILNYYQIFTLMLNNLNNDKIKFNKLYNIIEDEGVFMTRSEVETLNYFKKITNGISELNQNLISEFKKLNEGIDNLNVELKNLDGSLHMIDSTLGLIESTTDNIYLSI